MSSFVLKLIAMLTMLIDHSTVALYYCGALQSSGLYFVLRSIGRPAFPIFCFLLAVGYEKTSNREKYFSRLCLFAALSQLPFCLMTVRSNYSFITGGFAVSILPVGALLLIPLGVYFVYVCKKEVKPSLFLLAAALILACVDLTVGGYTLLSHFHLNVFYTLALSLACMRVLDLLLDANEDKVKKVLCFLAVAIFAVFFQSNADYSYEGLALCIFLHMLRGDKTRTLILTVLWCGFLYLLPIFSGQTKYLIMGGISMLAPLCIFFFNGKRGPKLRTAFYLVYPVHLAVLALLCVILRVF